MNSCCAILTVPSKTTTLLVCLKAILSTLQHLHYVCSCILCAHASMFSTHADSDQAVRITSVAFCSLRNLLFVFSSTQNPNHSYLFMCSGCITVFLSFVERICALPPDPGNCTALKQRFFFNCTSNTCEQFQYRGCYGNQNNFKEKSTCLEVAQDQGCYNDTHRCAVKYTPPTACK